MHDNCPNKYFCVITPHIERRKYNRLITHYVKHDFAIFTLIGENCTVGAVRKLMLKLKNICDGDSQIIIYMRGDVYMGEIPYFCPYNFNTENLHVTALDFYLLSAWIEHDITILLDVLDAERVACDILSDLNIDLQHNISVYYAKKKLYKNYKNLHVRKLRY
jgi:hypothetical protein